MSADEREVEREVRAMAKRQPGTPESVIRAAVRNRLDRLARVRELADRAGISLEAAEEALRQEASDRLAVRWSTAVEAGRQALTGNPEPSTLAKEKVPEIAVEYWKLARSTKRVSRRTIATRVGIRHETITAWVRNGWMTWPPKKPPI